MSDTVTQCPSCATSFRVSQEQLDIADGRVRCGQCMHIFSALDHVVAPAHSIAPGASSVAPPEPEPEPESEPEPEPEPKATLGPTPSPIASPSNFFSADDDADEDPWHGIGEEPVELVQAELEQEEDIDSGEKGLVEDEFGDFEVDDVQAVDFDLDDVTQIREAADPEATQLSAAALDDDDMLFDDLGPRRGKDVVADELLRREALQNSDFDESFFDSLNETELEEDDETRLALPPLRREPPSADVDPDADTVLWDAAAAIPRARDQDSDTRWALEMIDDLHRDKNEPATTLRSVNDDFAFDDATQLDSFNFSGEIDRQFDTSGDFADDYDHSGAGYVSDFDRARRGGWLWFVGSLLLVMLIAGQYLVFNFTELATDDRFRPVLERACAVFACELPVLESLDKISSEKLVVRSHPDKSNALMVDVIITNRANFAQPFPALELAFSDVRGKVVTTQSFYPSEYLQGELSGMTLMPSKNPIHLKLDIDDPGSAAINYKLTLVKGYD